MADIYEAQQAQYQGAIGRTSAGGYSSSTMVSGLANSIAPAQQDTLASLIGTVMSLSDNLHTNNMLIADSLAGTQPQGDCAKAPTASSALDALRRITYTLEAAIGESNRAKRALGIQ
jgi:hypothetical protein